MTFEFETEAIMSASFCVLYCCSTMQHVGAIFVILKLVFSKSTEIHQICSND